MTESKLNSPKPEAITTGTLFVDLVNSVQLSEVLSPDEYNTLINDFQSCMYESARLFEKKKYVDGRPFTIGDFTIAGDQLVMFFFEKSEIELNRELMEKANSLSPERKVALQRQLDQLQSNILLELLLAAIDLKTRWLIHEHNLQRVRQKRDPIEIAIGIHMGEAIFDKRYDGNSRVEGFHISYGKRVEAFSRNGLFSRIMVSEPAYNYLCNASMGEWNLRERFFFHQHSVISGELQGISSPKKLYELKYYHAGLQPLQYDEHKALSSIFDFDPNNLWAYYLLFDNAYYPANESQKSLKEGFDLAQRANRHNPNEEKVLLDLARCARDSNNPGMADELAKRSIELNPAFSLGYQFLGALYYDMKRIDERIVVIRKALSLCFGSPGNNMRLGMALCQSGDLVEGEMHMNAAKQAFPGYLGMEELLPELVQMEKDGCLPKRWKKNLPKPTE